MIQRMTGRYAATYLPRTPGGYQANIIATAADGSEIGRRQTGWVSQPAVGSARRSVLTSSRRDARIG